MYSLANLQLVLIRRLHVLLQFDASKYAMHDCLLKYMTSLGALEKVGGVGAVGWSGLRGARLMHKAHGVQAT